MRVAGFVGTAAVAPEGATLVFDEGCGYCRKWVGRVARLDRRGAVRLLPLQDPTAVKLTGQPVSRLHEAAHFVRADGSVFAGAAAARELLRCLPGGGFVAALTRVPGVMPLGEWVYGWAARRWGPVAE